MFDDAYYVRCEEEYAAYIERSINTIITDIVVEGCFDPPSKLKGLIEAREFLKEFTEMIALSLKIMRGNLYLLTSRKMTLVGMKEDRFQDEEAEIVRREISFKERLLLKYHFSLISKLGFMIDRELKYSATNSPVQ